MLKSLCKGACALAAVMSFSAAAQAEDHVIMIVDGSYFPATIYAAEGDALIFQNESSSEHTITGENDAWTSGSIAMKDTFTLEVTEATPATFSGGEEAVGEIVLQ